MNFSEALKAMKMGNKVSREAWRGKISHWCINKDKKLVRVETNGFGYLLGIEFLIQAEDILAEDWFLVT